MNELYKIHRPKKLSNIVGNEQVVKMLESKAKKDKIPHSILLSGPSGCGKTTLARIIAKLVDCGKRDIREINCADFRGIDTIRDIRSRMNLAPISGSSRVYIIDECHKLSNDAQNAFLKQLEDTPSHVYFILATTEPNRVIKTIRTRCTEISVKSLTTTQLSKLVSSVLKKENKKLSSTMITKIAENSEGSARKALVFLDQVIDMDDEKDMGELILASSDEIASVEIVKALLKTGTKWKDMSAILKSVDLKNAESIRYLVMAYSKAVLLNSGSSRAFLILDAFKDNFYDSKEAGLVHACYCIINGE